MNTMLYMYLYETMGQYIVIQHLILYIKRLEKL
nr:MAG TPA: hypothetical protein [Caudoviricetes sp.]